MSEEARLVKIYGLRCPKCMCWAFAVREFRLMGGRAECRSCGWRGTPKECREWEAAKEYSYMVPPNKDNGWTWTWGRSKERELE